MERPGHSEAACVLTAVGPDWLAADAFVPGMQAWKQAQGRQEPGPA